MNETKLCPLCQKECKFNSQIDNVNNTGRQPVHLIECPVCGRYVITQNALNSLQNRQEHLHIISGVTRNYYESNDRLFIIAENLIQNDSEFEARILSTCPKSTQEKMNNILTYIEDKSLYPGDQICIDTNKDYTLFYCKNEKELRFYLGHLEFLGLIGSEQSMRSEKMLKLSGEGWKRVEELARPNIKSTQAFVAMWFDDKMTLAYSEGIATLEEDTGFTMLRIDMKEFNDKICDKILAEIRKSRFLIADVTGQRQGVYFEAGFALGLGLPVIWTCREDQIDDCHFDTRQYNHITWNNPSDLHEKLKNRILATIG